jgi:hypothetical protein
MISLILRAKGDQINIRKAVLRILLKFGFVFKKCTPRAKLIDFIKKVKPVSTQLKLIRVGGPGDGGYLLPDDLTEIRTCFSPGVSNTANFELELANIGIDCFLADYSVEKAPITHPRFDFEKKFIGPSESEIFITLEGWMTEKGLQGADSILQMDIEGAEYASILATPQEAIKKFRIIVIEFHAMDDLLDPKVFPFISATFDKLLQDFKVVHIHPNNASDSLRYMGVNIWPTMEFTFLRKDRITKTASRKDFPHDLDFDNAPNKRNCVLSSDWF